MIYSYKRIVTPGPQGHIKEYRPADSEYTETGPKSTHLVEFDGLHYIHIPKDLEPVEQDPEIDFKPVTLDERLSIVLRQFADPVRQRDAYFDCLTLDGQKAFMHDEVDAAAAKFEDNLNKQMYFTSALGFRVNGDRRTATNIAGLISTYDIPPNSGKPVQYRDYDNQDQSLNKEQLQQMYLEHLANGNALYQQKWAMEAAIDSAQSMEELEAVDTTFKMQDFAKPLVQEERKLNLNIFGL